MSSDLRFALVVALAAASRLRARVACVAVLGQRRRQRQHQRAGRPGRRHRLGHRPSIRPTWPRRRSRTRDLALPSRDPATPSPPSPDLAMPRDLAMAPPDLTVVSSCHLVINEIQTGTTATATEEFVEIANPCTSAITVDSFKLVYRAASNTNVAQRPRTPGRSTPSRPAASPLAPTASSPAPASAAPRTARSPRASPPRAPSASATAAGIARRERRPGARSPATLSSRSAAWAPLPPVTLASPGGLDRPPPQRRRQRRQQPRLPDRDSASTPGAANP